MANSCIEYAFKAVYDNHKNKRWLWKDSLLILMFGELIQVEINTPVPEESCI